MRKLFASFVALLVLSSSAYAQPPAFLATGSISANGGSVQIMNDYLPMAGTAVVTVKNSGTYTLQVQGCVFDCTVSGNWFIRHGVNATDSTMMGDTFSAPTTFEVSVAGLRGIRVIATAYTSGAPVVTIGAGRGASSGAGSGGSGGGGGGGDASAANQTTEITALQLIDDLPNALGSTTSGQKGALALGAVTTSAPSYTNAQTNALSLTPAGELRTNFSSQTGTITVQPGNTPNTTPWLMNVYAPLPAGTNTIGKLGANSGVVIGDVNVNNGSATATVGGVSSVALTWNQYPTLKSGGTSAMTGTTSTQVIAAVASNYLYISSCSVNNTHATVDTLVNLQDGSGGSTIWTFTAPHGYSGESHPFPIPIKVPTIGNGLYAVNATTGASVIVFCQGFASTVSY